jgi:glycosyltransferase involved in cell wall biosynthesis
LGLYNDYIDIEHKVKKETIKHELFASIVIPFNKGHDILERTIISLTKQTYSRDRFEVIIVADDSHVDAKLINEQFKRELDIKLIAISNYCFGAASSRNTGIHVAKGILLCLWTQI